MNRSTLALALSLLAVLGGCGGSGGRGSWAEANGDVAAVRAAEVSPITAHTVGQLRARWRFPLGNFASAPVADIDTIYVQDLRSNVFALDPANGALRWRHRYNSRSDGPNGVAVNSGRVYGVTRDSVFALASRNGRELWQRHVTNTREPIVWNGLLFTSSPKRMYALDANTGRVRWQRFDRAFGESVDPNGRLYAGTSSRLLVLDAKTGKLQWTVARIDEFESTPILANVGAADLVFGVGKAGGVGAWDRSTKRRRWTTSVGCGVEAPMAYASARLFVPVGGSCRRLVAIDAKNGTVLWERKLDSPALGCATVANDVVFTATAAGVVYGFSTRDGKLLWHATMRAGVNACPALVGGLLVVSAGPEVVAFALPKTK